MWTHLRPAPSDLPDLFEQYRYDFSNGTVKVVDAADMTPERFYREHVALGVPTVLRGAVTAWPAYRLWTNEWLREQWGEETVVVDLAADNLFHKPMGARFVRPDFREMPLATFIDLLERGEGKRALCPRDLGTGTEAEAGVGAEAGAAAGADAGGSGGSGGAGDGIGADGGGEGCITVHHAIEQLDLSEHLSCATANFSVPPWASFLQLDQRNLWMAARNKVSLLHFDFYENLLAQVAGTKEVTLFSPMEAPNLYPTEWHEYAQRVYDGTAANAHGGAADPRGARSGVARPRVDIERLDGLIENFSPVNIHDPDLAAFPRFAAARAVNVTLRAGDMLFLPSLWWHQVNSSVDAQGRNLAVNLWFKTHSALGDAMFNVAMQELVDDQHVREGWWEWGRRVLVDAGARLRRPGRGRARYTGATDATRPDRWGAQPDSGGEGDDDDDGDDDGEL